MIDRPTVDDALIPARLALRLVWCAAADDTVLYDPLRICVDQEASILDEIDAAAIVNEYEYPILLSGRAEGSVLRLHVDAADAASRRAPIFSPGDVQDPDAPVVLAWTAGRGMLVSHHSLQLLSERFVHPGAGFVTVDRLQTESHWYASLGLSPEQIPDAEWVVLGGRPTDDPRSTSAPLRRFDPARDV